MNLDQLLVEYGEVDAIVLLRGIIEDITREFGNARAADIDPRVVNYIAIIALSLRNKKQYEKHQQMLMEIEDRCYAANANYREQKNRFYFYSELRIIAEITKDFLGLL